MPWNTRAATSSVSVPSGAGHRTKRKQRKSRDVDALVADPIAKRCERQQKDRDRQLVGVDHPDG